MVSVFALRPWYSCASSRGCLMSTTNLGFGQNLALFLVYLSMRDPWENINGDMRERYRTVAQFYEQ
jgi:hypothetical protein